MKTFLTLTLAAIASVSLFAGTPRVDITSTGENKSNKLTPGTVEGGLKVSLQNWGEKETQSARITAAGTKLTGDDWQLCKLVFTPESDGAVYVAFCGQWAKETADREWLAISAVKVNGEPVSNSDLTATRQQDGKTLPADFGLTGKAAYVADGGPNGTGAAIVNHDSRMGRALKVEGGKPVTIEFMAKPADAQK